MNNTVFTAAIILLMAGIGGGAYIAMGASAGTGFDYKTASAAERSAFLEKKARGMKNKFKPNYLAKGGEYSVTSNAIHLSYNTGMGSLACGTEIDCDVMQCERYLGNAVSKYDIPVKLLYTDMNGRRVDSQSLSTSSCQSKIKRWEAGAARRKAKKARDKKEMCSDDYVGMKPMFGC